LNKRRTKDNQPDLDDIHQDPTIRHVLDRMPDDVAESFSDEQLMHLRNAIGARNWGHHSLDWRGTFGLPFSRWRWYYVILMGKNRRTGNHGDTVSKGFARLIAVVFMLFSMMLGLVLLYLVKSFLGIDLFEDYHLGLWHWLNDK
tara:strand:+ start:208 stop:639 length:432 start_codon:yes stop_codon:yes gene_type:complete